MSPTRAKGQRLSLLPRRPAHRAPALSAARSPCAPASRVRAPPGPDSSARPASAARPPWPAPARPAAAATECHGAIALLPPLCTMSGRRGAPSPGGQGRRPAAAAGAGGPGGGGAGRGGGRTGCGRGASRTAAAAVSSRARLNFLYSPERRGHPDLRGPVAGPRQRRTAELGAGSPGSPVLPSKLSSAASPTAIFPGRRRRRSCPQLLPRLQDPIAARRPPAQPALHPPSPPAELPTAPGPHRGSSCSRRFAHSVAPADHLPTAGAERCQLSSLPPH